MSGELGLAANVDDRPRLKRYDLWRPQEHRIEHLQAFCEYYQIEVPENSKQTAKTFCQFLNLQRIPRVDDEDIQKLGKSPDEEYKFTEDEIERIRTWKVNTHRLDFTIADVTSYYTDYGTIEYYMHCAGGLGSSGVFMVQHEHGVCVLKEGSEVYSEIIAHNLGRYLASNPVFAEPLQPPAWKMPRIRPLYHSQEAFQQIIERLETLEEPRTQGTQADRGRIERLAKTNHMMIMEFVNGTGIHNLPDDHKAVEQVFDNSVLHSLGKAVLYDMLINNWDRIPLHGIWSNGGNGSNIMFDISRHAPKLVLIDQAVTVIKLDKQRVKYMDDVREFVQKAMEEYNQDVPEPTAMKSVQEFVIRNTSVAHNIDHEGQKQMLIGFCQGVLALQDLNEGNIMDFGNEALGAIQTKDGSELQMRVSEGIEETVAFIWEVIENVKAALQ